MLFCQRLLYLMLFPGCLVFQLPLERRKDFWPRFLVCAALLYGAGLAFFCALDFLNMGWLSNFYWLIRPLMSLGVAVLMVKVCMGSLWPEAVGCGIWSYLAREYCYDFTQIMLKFLTANRTFDWKLAFTAITILGHGVVYIGLYWLVAKNLSVNGHCYQSWRELKLPLILTGLVTVVKPIALFVNNTSFEYSVFIFVQVLCSFFVMAAIYTQCATEKRLKLEQELDTQKQLWRQHRIQMEHAQKNAELLRIKHHDLKHYIAMMQAQGNSEQLKKTLSDVEDAVKVFESYVQTGNAVLDTVLTEKSLLCEHQNIVLSCVADGALLRHLEAVDLYVLFGNAVDNAVECVTEFSDSQRRVIAISVFRVENMVKIQIENFYQGDLIFRDDLPITTKENKGDHGFGLKSIRDIAEKYDGYISVSAKDGLFVLHILLPLVADYEEKATE